MLPLQLLLFARPFDIPLISDTLDQAGIYLEHPATYSPAMHNGYRYQNPHNPAAGVGGDRRRQLLQGLQGGALRAPVKAQDVARQQVEDVFQNLKSGVDLDEEEPAPTIATKLYPHQKQALSFLLDRERIIDVPATATPNDETIVALWKRKLDPYNRPVGWMNVVADLEIKGAAAPPQPRGSILADDMGLGKTIVVISLVAATLPEARTWAEARPDKERIDPRFDGVSNDKGKARLSLADFSSHTYGADNPHTGSFSATGKGLSKKKEAKLKRERKREDAVATRFTRLVTRSRGTLIVCPLSTVQNWESQIEEHVVKASGMSVYVYHGNTRLSDPLKLADYDVVVTTFSTLGTEYSKQSRAEDEREEDEAALLAAKSNEDSSDDAPLDVYDLNGVLVQKPKPIDKDKKKRKRKKVEGSGASPLQQIQWFRVVLDEAQ